MTWQYMTAGLQVAWGDSLLWSPTGEIATLLEESHSLLKFTKTMQFTNLYSTNQSYLTSASQTVPTITRALPKTHQYLWRTLNLRKNNISLVLDFSKLDPDLWLDQANQPGYLTRQRHRDLSQLSS